MLANRHKSIETRNNDDSGGNALTYDLGQLRRDQAIRVAIKQIGDKACENYKYVKRYPCVEGAYFQRSPPAARGFAWGGELQLKSYPKSIFVEEGIQSGNTALIQLGLDLGVSVNDPITAPRTYALRVPAGSTPLYIAVYEYGWPKKSSLEALRFVIAAGARYDPSSSHWSNQESHTSARRSLKL